MNIQLQADRVSNATYHNVWPEISSSRFKPFYESPAAYRWPLPVEPCDAFDLGTATHACILEPEKVDGLLVLPDVGFRTKADKNEWRQWLTEAGNQVSDDLSTKDEILRAARDIAVAADADIVTPEQLDLAHAMAASVAEHGEAQEALNGSLNELSFRANGRKARPDALNGSLLIDVKTTSAFNRFQWAALDYRYPESLAWYEKVLTDCDVVITHWLWIAVETKPYRLNAAGENRHRVKVWIADEQLRLETLDKLDSALDRFAICQENDDWPDEQAGLTTLYGKKK